MVYLVTWDNTMAAYTPATSFLSLLAILFIGLKLTGTGSVATWSWVWVLSPLWICWVVILSVFVFYIALQLVKSLCGK